MSRTTQRINVILALVMRDVRTRFGGSYLGYIIAVGWPLAHLSALVFFLGILRTSTPLGTDNAVFVATGSAPYILCLYPARQMTQSIAINRPRFVFPIVGVLDVIFARAIVEIITALIVVIIFYTVASIAGIDLTPIDPPRAALAILGIIYLAIGLGLVNTIMISLFAGWRVVFIVGMIASYTTAGVMIVPSMLPQQVQNLMWYNPLYQLVTWMRSAYYEGYGDGVVSPTYVFWYGTICMLIGLLGERFLRGKMKAP